MLLDIDFSPLPWNVFLFYFIFLGVFIWFRKHFRKYIWIFPIILFLLLIQPKFIIQYPVKKKLKKLYIDNSISMSLVDHSMIKKVVHSFGSNIDEILFFDGSPVDKKVLDSRYSFIDKLSPIHSIMQKEEAVFITDISQLSKIKLSNQIRLPFQKKIQGLFDVKLPGKCYIGEICNIKTLVHVVQKTKVVFKLNQKIIKSRYIPYGFSGWVSFKHYFPVNSVPKNYSGEISIESHSNSNDPFHKIHFILMVKKGIPSGYFYFPKNDLLSWRLSHILQKNPYLSIEVGKDRKKYFYSNYEFIGGMIDSLNQITNVKKYGMYIWPRHHASIPQKIVEAGWRKIISNTFTKGKKYLFLWDFPLHAKDVFLPTHKISQFISDFAQKLRVQLPPFPSTYPETGKQIELLQSEAKIPLRHKNYEIQKSTDAFRNIVYFSLPFSGEYKYKDFKFYAGIQREELLSIFKSNKDSFKKDHASIMKQIEDIKNRKISSSFTEEILFQFGLTYLTEKKYSIYAIYISVFLLFLTILLFWFFSGKNEIRDR